MEKASHILKSVFGYEQFLPLQADVIASILEGRDTLAVMPTGGGKSLCYQIPALIFDGLTVVISPLISLMTDQVMQLAEAGVPAVVLNSQLDGGQYRHNLSQLKRGEAKILYLAPETFFKNGIQDLLAALKVSCVAVDEAHCISKWGHDFRPEYRHLGQARRRFGRAVWLALTATATPQVRTDIQKNLVFETPRAFVASFDRPNLFLQIVEKNNPGTQVLDALSAHSGQSGIIYCATRKAVDNLCAFLQRKGVAARPYHAGLSDAERIRHQTLFVHDDIQVIVATVAFGMGINKPDVRFVLHHDLPHNIESYYQEIGRAGRDGQRADCILLFSYGDIPKIRYFIQQKTGHAQRLATLQLNDLLQYVEADDCRRVSLLKHFGEDHAGGCGMCDNCLSGGEPRMDVTVAAQKFLSCVKRTGERFGANYIVDVLRGSQSKRVLQFNHQRLSTYGIGKEHTRKQWLHLARQFQGRGLIESDPEYGGLRLTPRGVEVFKGRKVMIRSIPADTAGPRPAAGAPAMRNPELLEALRRKRKALADAAGLPPYAIFPDRTLVEMAAYLPRTHPDLLQIHGVGTVRLENYGDAFLEVIEAHREGAQIAEPPNAGARFPTARNSSESQQARWLEIGEAYQQGQSIADIMARYNIQQQTVVNHLYAYVQSGRALRTDGLTMDAPVSEARRTAVFRCFEELGTQRLKPVFEALDGTVNYEILKMLRICFLAERPAEP